MASFLCQTEKIELCAERLSISASVRSIRPRPITQHAPLRYQIVRRETHEYADAPHPLLLRARRERPRCRRAAEQRDERAPLHLRGHSMTSSAIASSPGGKLRPNALAVLRLITNSNLVDCMTGKSAGFAPLRTRPT